MLKSAVEEVVEIRRAASLQVKGAQAGFYLELTSTPEGDLNIKGLETGGIEVVAVNSTTPAVEGGATATQTATLFLPEQAVDSFGKRLERYANDEPKQPREARYERVFDPVAKLGRAELNALWTDNPRFFPTADQAIWMEVWLRRHDGHEVRRFTEFACHQGIQLGGRRLSFDDRIVLLAYTSPSQIAGCLMLMGDLAELRCAQETASFFAQLPVVEQRAWAKDVNVRTLAAPPSAPAICLLDTGVNRRHPLLELSLAADDCHACDPEWGPLDTNGHGTEMAGLALYGDLVDPMISSSVIELPHRLESVRVLPPTGENEPDLYGALSAMAVSLVEVEAPERSRVFSMAITAPQFSDGGQPTSWSAALDALAAGRGFDASSQGLVLFEQDARARRRLFVLSAGNVPHTLVQDAGASYLDRCDLEVVQDPAQAWNALTVGAYTEKVDLPHADWDGYQPLAKEGDLCPWSCTGVAFDKEWPNKPDVVMEGGNAMLAPNGEVDFGCDELSLLTTFHEHQRRLYTTTNATSAACSQAARMTATICNAYPNLWPESIRALMVHSAQWTEQMHSHLPRQATKSSRALLLRRYGYGVPNLSRALRSANDALTLIAQDQIQPYAKTKGVMKMRHLHLYELPWPRETLLELGEQEVELRLTLSYFIEPNPGRMGWRQRHRYASARLRFDVKRPTESLDEFEKRLNKAALAAEEVKPEAGSDAHAWKLGSRVRERGSLHSDSFASTGAELAECGVVGVYPVSGWWKDQPKRARANATVPYSLIISIETAATNVDLWTPVQQILEQRVAVEAG